MQLGAHRLAVCLVLIVNIQLFKYWMFSRFVHESKVLESETNGEIKSLLFHCDLSTGSLGPFLFEFTFTRERKLNVSWNLIK